MSESEGGGQPPPKKTPPHAFKPRQSLLRTPPPNIPPPPMTYNTTSDEESAAEAVAATAARKYYDEMLELIRSPSSQEAPQAAKRLLSPDDAATSTRKRIMRRVGRPCQPLTLDGDKGDTTPETPRDFRSPIASDDEEDNLDMVGTRTLLKMANRSAASINSVIRAPVSRLNKADSSKVADELAKMLEIVSHLAILVGETKKVAEVGNAKLDSLEDALKRERHAVEEERRRADAAATQQHQPLAPPPSFADKVRGYATTARGPIIKVVPTDQVGNKTAEETKRILKTSIAPAKLDIKVDRLKKISGAAVLVQTRSKQDLDRLKAAMPANLKAEPMRGRQPLVAFKNIEGGDQKIEDILKAVKEQNIKEDPDWPLERLIKSCQMAFKKSRSGGDRTTYVVRCEPALRKKLIELRKVYIGWEVVEVVDFTTEICCRRCQLYGHSEKGCKADAPTCGQCGHSGHKAEDCKSTTRRCATCHKFGHTKSALEHRTASAECPARAYAERRMVQSTNY